MKNNPIFYVRDLVKWTGGELLQGSPDDPIFGVSFDTRTIERGELFVALVAQRDGHDFIPRAVEKGCSALLVQKKVSLPPDVPAVLVSDTLRAMGDAAHHYRMECGREATVIAVTGSNGKTTTKELLRSLFSQAGPTLATEGNYNNLLGVPLTLFGLRREHRFAVIEMGMNAPGEIQRLAQIARPQVGIITTVAPAHLEGLGTIENVADAKAELFRELPEEATAVVNADVPLIVRRAEKIGAKKFYFSIRPETPWPSHRSGLILREYRSLGTEGYKIKIESRNTREFPADLELHLPLVGRHHLSNALAAAAAGWCSGLSAEQIADGLARFTPPARRTELLALSGGNFLLDDCYNSNPGSAEAALETLVELAGEGAKKIAVLGDMLELGEEAPELHRRVGRKAAQLGVDYLITVGPLSRYIDEGAGEMGLSGERRFHFEEFQKGEIKELLSQLSKDGNSWFLVKASRGIRLERVSQLLRELHL